MRRQWFKCRHHCRLRGGWYPRCFGSRYFYVYLGYALIKNKRMKRKDDNKSSTIISENTESLIARE